jgi:hypothetical protein
MKAETNSTIERFYDVLGHLVESTSSETAVTLYDAFEKIITYRPDIRTLVDDGFIEYEQVLGGDGGNIHNYWITSDGLNLYNAIKKGDLFKTSEWESKPELFQWYLRNGNEQFYLPYILSKLTVADFESYQYLPKSKHPVALAIHAALCNGGNASNIPDEINLSDYSYKGAQVSEFAQVALDKLMELHDVKTMKKARLAREGSLSSILEFSIIFTFMHFDSIKAILEATNDNS